MGVHYLVYHHEHTYSRLPLKITFNTGDDAYLETENNINQYKQLASGELKSIGIDGSVFIHSHIIGNKIEKDSITESGLTYLQKDKNYLLVGDLNDNSLFSINVKCSVTEISNKIIKYVKIICIFYELFFKEENCNLEANELEKAQKVVLNKSTENKNEIVENKNKITQNEPEIKVTKKKENVILHFVIDGKAPVKKNRVVSKTRDLYTLLQPEQKDYFHRELCNNLKNLVLDFNKNNNNFNLIFLSNENRPYENRGEGELALYSFCHEINKKNNYNPKLKHVIVSNDSDVVAIMMLRNDPSMVVISPPSGKNRQIYITNNELIRQGLKLTSVQLISYTILHFILFGSDYNIGLINPSENKKSLIYDAIKQGENNINEICTKCIKRVIKKELGPKKKKINPKKNQLDVRKRNRKRENEKEEEEEEKTEEEEEEERILKKENVPKEEKIIQDKDTSNTKRLKNKINDKTINYSKDFNQFLSELKTILILEAICSILYYKSLGNETYLKDYSPLAYLKTEIKRYKALLTFSK